MRNNGTELWRKFSINISYDKVQRAIQNHKSVKKSLNETGKTLETHWYIVFDSDVGLCRGASWETSVLQSLAPTLIKHTCLYSFLVILKYIH